MWAATATSKLPRKSWWNGLSKVNVRTGEVTRWSREDHWPHEPTFVPRPGATDEEDGVVLSVVLGSDKDEAYGSSYLVGLDGRTFQPLFEAKVPLRVPYASHGNWYPRRT